MVSSSPKSAHAHGQVEQASRRSRRASVKAYARTERCVDKGNEDREADEHASVKIERRK
jgi:hypothetical protein